MLKEIIALEILDDSLDGGTTKPMLVICDDGNKYVLKIFKEIHAKQRCYTGAEVCAYLLAKEFNLCIPDGALITIPIQLIELIKKSNKSLYRELATKDYSKPCFGSLYLETLPTYTPTLKDKYLDLDELETIFAFDLFILNEDRKNTKPNILKSSEHYFLIDHEKAFEGSAYALKQFKENELVHYYKSHIFFKTLMKIKKKHPNSVNFETFIEFLRFLNLKTLRKQIERLETLEYSVSECYEWLNYLEEIKKNSTKFVDLLKKNLDS
jgi:hypothetical protein